MTKETDFEAIDAFIAQQRQQHCSPIEAIKALRTAFELKLSLAKQLVAIHPAWQSIVEANRPLQDEVAQMFEELNTTPESSDSLLKP